MASTLRLTGSQRSAKPHPANLSVSFRVLLSCVLLKAPAFDLEDPLSRMKSLHHSGVLGVADENL
jgi:hypothetical protein